MSKIKNKIIGLIILLFVSYVFFYGIIYPALDSWIKDIIDSLNLIAAVELILVVVILLVCGSILFFIVIDWIFGTRISERIIATLVSNILWELIKYAFTMIGQRIGLYLKLIGLGIKTLWDLLKNR